MSLLEAARPAAQRLRPSLGGRPIELVARSNADGVAATTVLAKALSRIGQAFHCRFEPFEASHATSETDLDAAPLRVLLGVAEATTPLPPAKGCVVVAPPTPVPERAHHWVLDPTAAGTSASVSTTALAIALCLSDHNWDLAPLALAGARGAVASNVFQGWNDFVQREARRRGLLEEGIHLALDDAPLLDLLAYPPSDLADVLPSGYESAAAFLARHGLPPEASLHELGPHEQEVLASALALTVLRGGQRSRELARLFGPLQRLGGPDKVPLASLAVLFEAAAREQDAGLALAFGMGDPLAKKELEAVVDRYFGKLRAVLQGLERERPAQEDGVRCFRVAEPAYLEPAVTLVGERFPPRTRLTLAYVASGDAILIAGHAPEASKFAVNPLLLEAAQALGGRRAVTGGYPLAAVPADALPRFLRHVAGLWAPPVTP